jgi:transcriptional regulator with XRE-family HTH domain
MDKKLFLKENFKHERRSTGLKQPEFAQLLQLPHKRYQSYEDGRAIPYIGTLGSIVDYFGYTLDEFCFEDLSKRE